MSDLCIWEDCDQEAVYCEGHSHELVNPLELDIRGLQARVESLTAENKRLRAVYEAAKDAVEQNPPYVTLWLEGEVEAIAATEQG